MILTAVLSLVLSPPLIAVPEQQLQKEWQLLRKRVKHVFILYQENRSFDHYFGTFPGAEGLFSHPAAHTPGFNQTFIGVDGKPRKIHPFRIGPAQYAADTADVDHSHSAIVAKMNVVQGKPKMNRFALVEERKHAKTGNPSLSAVQYGELAMAYVDGDTIPILWRWANRFTLCDHIFQTITGPSTPGNLAIIAAQSGVSQWIQHPEQASGASPYGPGVPVENDANPFWGSTQDKTADGKMPYNPDDFKYPPQINLTYPTLPLTLAGGSMGETAEADRDRDGDLGDIQEDVGFLTKQGKRSIPWGWYEEGYDREPTDMDSSDPVDAGGSHASYITHHNGPQYFGYIANNPKMSANLHGLNDLYVAIRERKLPKEGVFYVKGGYKNLMGLHPACPDPDAQKAFVGDDDHPAYSDAQISEALLAKTVNAIARSPYWKDSVIIITWDDSEGDYDHVPPPVRTVGPDKQLVSEGPRVPMIVLSPFAKTHTVFHGVGDQSSVVKFVDKLFGLTPLADLPVERRLRAIGKSKGIADPGPRDDLTPGIDDLLGTLDVQKLSGKKRPLAASYAEIPDRLVYNIPQRSGYGLKQLGIVPTDRRKHIKNEIPADFSPRPKH
ncbi:MAG TPA: alkaline phosphatase family protein [Fimbriimonadaceae bacterium]|nr:alkaline phosphatase family protein [Fimbriimonadaceae bacterium]